MELVLEVWVQVSQSQGHESKRVNIASCNGGMGWPRQGSAGELTLVVLIRDSQGLTNSATAQAQIQGSELAHPKIYIICEHLGCVKGPVLLTQSCRVFRTLCNSRIIRSSPG